MGAVREECSCSSRGPLLNHRTARLPVQWYAKAFETGQAQALGELLRRERTPTARWP